MAQNKNSKVQISNDGHIEVLYQKMGDRWFAFSMIEDEVFVGSITQAEIDGSVSSETLPLQGNS